MGRIFPGMQSVVKRCVMMDKELLKNNYVSACAIKVGMTPGGWMGIGGIIKVKCQQN